MGKATHLTVDVRKAFDAGIGTYIRNVVPRVLERLGSDVRVAALVPAHRRGEFDWLAPCNVDIVPVHAAPMGLAEQVELRRRLVGGTVFWATSLAHPLGRRAPVVATVYDVAQLALGPSEGVATHVAWAAKLMLASQRRRARALIAISDFTRKEFIRYVGPPNCGRIDVAPLAADASWFAAAPPLLGPGARPYFVIVGSVRPHKNIARVLQAFAAVAERIPHELVIAGLGAPHGEHHQWRSALPAAAQTRVRFTGLLEEALLRNLVAGADALVFPSLYEGFGLPALEAMAAGCPVLASSAGSLPEVCADAAAAYFEPRSVEQIGQALVRHAGMSAVKRQAIVARGVAHARKFTWERTADLTATAVEAVLRSPGSAP